MKATRLVACVLALFSGSAVSWAQLTLKGLSQDRQDRQINKYGGIATTGLGADSAWASTTPRVSEFSALGPTELSLAGAATGTPRYVAPTRIASEEVFSLSLQSRSAALTSGVVANTTPHVVKPSAVGVSRPIVATWSTSPTQLPGSTQQLVTLGDASESLAPLSLPTPSPESLLKNDNAPAWLPTAGVR